MENRIKSQGVKIELNIAPKEEGCIFCEEFGGLDEFFYFVAENMEHILKAMETERVELIFKSPDGNAVAKIDGVEFEVLIKNTEKM